MSLAAINPTTSTGRRRPSVKLLITSTDCDPRTELSFPYPSQPTVTWNNLVEALSNRSYCFATRHLPSLSSSSSSRNPRPAFLILNGSKKAAFFYTNNEGNDYQITYDESLMDGLPSDGTLDVLPRFHLFESLPEDLQVAVAERLDAAGLAMMRCVSRKWRRFMWWRRPEIEEPGEGRLVFRLVQAACFVIASYIIVKEVGPV
ncbi:F-box and associated interaction domains-containing protein [Striga asiatica]|uniref:F-box and associated interaction domains-containing protein n=1 Tax=Striga asiatica TaxID=4170 RepID=A0A5A7P259_STRAF|nr:F-box and associated interaction domains-containing protein [Striga asiatica]